MYKYLISLDTLSYFVSYFYILYYFYLIIIETNYYLIKMI